MSAGTPGLIVLIAVPNAAVPSYESSVILVLTSGSGFSASPQKSGPNLSDSTVVSVGMNVPASTIACFLVSVFFYGSLSSADYFAIAP